METAKMMELGESSKKRKAVPNDPGFIQSLFSWSLEDIYNKNLYKNQVEKIPQTFQSVEHYFGSYVYPLLEETRARLHSVMEIISEAPVAEVIAYAECKPYGTRLYDVNVDSWRNRFSDRGKEPYKTLPGDIFVLTDAKLETDSDLQRVERSWMFALVTRIQEDENEDNSTSTNFKVETLKDIEVVAGIQKSLFVIFLTNITTNKRIWNALHMPGNLEIIKEVLFTDSAIEEDCDICSVQSDNIWDEKFGMRITSELNTSQSKAVLSCLHKMHCNHKSTVELIWGPPGTGKTKTTGMLLFALLRMKYRTALCTPTNVAIKEVASRVLKLVKESFDKDFGTYDFCSLGDIILVGNKDRLKVDSEIEEIYLDYRVERLAECFGPHTGWRHCFASMIDFLEDCVSQYHIYLENELINEREHNKEKEIKEKERFVETEGYKMEFKSFLEYVRKIFVSIAKPLKNCVFIFCTHIAKNYIQEQNFQDMISLIGLLDSFETLLFQDNLESKVLEELLSHSEIAAEDCSQSIMVMTSLLYIRRRECLSVLKKLQRSLKELKLPRVTNKVPIMEFCFQTASLIFCTASSSYKLHSVEMEPLNVLVIDEAAQLKECESTIPLQLPGIRHAILVGDEFQLLATVESNISEEAGFGKSLFERLSSLGHSKHFLNIQYRMHPSISFFPNSNFYRNEILDAPNVKIKNYEKHYLPLLMFGPYSFINIIGGREEKDDAGRSWRNMVEVAVVMKIMRNLYKAWVGSKQKLSVGVVSPYAAQVVAIQEKLGKKYDNLDGFAVKVQSVDGFQGGEEDIIIISTVRSNSGGLIGFVSNPRRTNVALTRARHCLWILGSERTLINSESVWEAVVLDAKNRQCFFNADDNKDLAKAILEVKKEFDQFEDLLNGDSILFTSTKWKVLFSENFLKSFKKLMSVRTKKSVINLLHKLSNGWRPKKMNVYPVCGCSSQLIKQFKVEGLYIVCAIDIKKEDLMYYQVLKIWDILLVEDIPKLVKRLDSLFGTYTEDFINRCKEICLEGNLEVPKSWETSFDIVQSKNLDYDEIGKNLIGSAFDGRSYVENAKVSESLLLMKFYSLSSGVVVSHLLSDRDGLELDLPFEVTDQELEIILFTKSTFILGRSGTGKTTVLTMKLFQKEKLHYQATEAFYGVKSNSNVHNIQEKEDEESVAEMKGIILRQLFVTVSPKLCYAVKQHVSRLKSSACGGNSSKQGSSVDMDDIDDAVEFKDIPDSFVDVTTKLYPLVITFHKFLMMLDGTLGNSYFERFHEVSNLSHGQIHGRSVALESFIRMKEVSYERFRSSYWPHFNTQLTKKLDSSIVFTEIMSHIKGGTRALDTSDGKLSREDYVLLSEVRVSSLSSQKRGIIYDIFQNYEKMKIENGEFDLADLVIDLHRRLRFKRYEGDEMHFIYVDEVQDLTLSQIALFKYICRNVEEGFVFSGDTAQTISRGIDFRFQDIRSLFYNKFLLESNSSEHDKRNEKGRISNIFHLSQNFRTHAGVLKLSQSVIELLYRFFHHSIDVLPPETSRIYGEVPVLLESGNNENAIITIFGNSGNVGGNIVGFGAEQVILVRDDCVRKEITNYVGKQALVLTIVECKGLEFQDVLLYNFFGSSPLKNQWRVIYEYMKEQGLLDCASPSFNMAKHNILCSELKQLYVAITRTRQRLWICENIEDFCIPMFDYWKKKCLVQVRQLDESLAQAMQVASSPKEWRSRGLKLYHECNYEIATMCFERAGDTYWERRSKAAGLRATADCMRSSNPEEANVVLREAADLYEAIGKADFAAQCFSDLGEFERAGRLYLEKCGASELEKAGECFSLAACHERAADVYAEGNFFSKCLTACAKGKLFDKGFQYIQYWKQHATMDFDVVRKGNEIEKIEQEFLESCAIYYYKLKDNRSLMKFVKAFHSIDLMRKFLKSLGCLDELLLLEEESGNFLEAANIAKLIGEILLEADLLGKGGNFKEASKLFLFYVLANSLWSSGSKGWPLKQFRQKEELLAKAKSLAKNESNNFYAFVCTEADILSNEQSNLSMMNNYLNASQRHTSVRGEILSARKILDAHLHSNSSKYVWEDDFVSDVRKNSEQMISRNQVSVETLVYFWNFWKDRIVNILEYLGRLETQDVIEYESYENFCLSYLGVQKQFHNLNAIYFLLNSDAAWVRELDNRFLRRNGKLVFIDVCQFVSTARSYWRSELLSVGTKVLENLEALYNFSLKNSFSLFCQSRSLTHIYEVAKILLECKLLDHRYSDTKTLQGYVKLSTDYFSDCIFPLDWRKSFAENMFSLRGTEVSRSLLKQVIFENIRSKSKLTYGQIGKVTMMILGLGKLNNELYVDILKRFDGSHMYQPWKAFIENLCGNMGTEFAQGTVPDSISGGAREMSLLLSFNEALTDTFRANWRREYDYISPSCFLYLVERLLILAFRFQLQDYFFTSKSSFAEWFIYQEGDTNPKFPSDVESLRNIYKFFVDVVYQLLDNKKDTMEWIKKSNMNAKDYYPLLVLRLVTIICLFHLNTGEYLNLLFNLLGRNYITEQLPREFCDVLRRSRKNMNVSVFAEAFKKIQNPLVIVSLGKSFSKSPDIIFMDMKVKQCREDTLRMLFPKMVKASQVQIGAIEVEAANSSSDILSSGSYGQKSCMLAPSNSTLVADQEDLFGRMLTKNFMRLLEIFETLELLENGKDPRSFLSNAKTMKADVEEGITLFTALMNGMLQKNVIDLKNQSILEYVVNMLNELTQLSAALDGSEAELLNNMTTIGELCRRMQSRNIVDQCDEKENNSKAKEISSSDKGKSEASQADVASGSGTQSNSQEIKNKGKGNNNSKKNKKGKGGRKR